MAQAAERAGRSPDSVRLVAVSKHQPAEKVRDLFVAGQKCFGENYVQEVQAKMAALPAGIDWHFIGHLQTNKVKAVVGKFSLIHGVDSLRLAKALHQQAESLKVVQDVLVQVNLGRESQKNGILPEDLPELADLLSRSLYLRWQGFMLMPPFFDDP